GHRLTPDPHQPDGHPGDDRGVRHSGNRAPHAVTPQASPTVRSAVVPRAGVSQPNRNTSTPETARTSPSPPHQYRLAAISAEPGSYRGRQKTRPASELGFQAAYNMTIPQSTTPSPPPRVGTGRGSHESCA